jgi:hypothetical protein
MGLNYKYNDEPRRFVILMPFPIFLAPLPIRGFFLSPVIAKQDNDKWNSYYKDNAWNKCVDSLDLDISSVRDDPKSKYTFNIY